MFEKCRYKWDYIPTQEKECGYEDIIDTFNIISIADFCALSEEEKDAKTREVIRMIRQRNIFPVFYFNHDGIIKEIKSVVNKNDVKFTGDQLVTQSSQGLLLLDYLFPNLHRAESGNATDNCMYERFYDDDKLFKCIKRYMSRYEFHNMRTPFFMYGRFFWNTATNFSPIRAKAIYEEFCPAGGSIYDYSCGFGGRMLGALSSKNNYTYCGCEPCKDTYYNLIQLGDFIEEATNRQGIFEIFNVCSEDFTPQAESIDFAFSCPPFFGLERYSDEPTQSINRYPKYEDWLEKYVRPTVRNCYTAVKKDGKYAVDIVDFTWRNIKYHLVKDWLRIAAEEGFKLIRRCPIVSRARKDTSEDTNVETVYVFEKSK